MRLQERKMFQWHFLLLLLNNYNLDVWWSASKAFLKYISEVVVQLQAFSIQKNGSSSKKVLLFLEQTFPV